MTYELHDCHLKLSGHIQKSIQTQSQFCTISFTYQVFLLPLWLQHDRFSFTNIRSFALVTLRSSGWMFLYNTSSHIWTGGFQKSIDYANGCPVAKWSWSCRCCWAASMAYVSSQLVWSWLKLQSSLIFRRMEPVGTYCRVKISRRLSLFCTLFLLLERTYMWRFSAGL